MLQIWLLYDLYFLLCAYIVAKPYVSTYVSTYGLATIYAHKKKVEIVKWPNLQNLFMLSGIFVTSDSLLHCVTVKNDYKCS